MHVHSMSGYAVLGGESWPMLAALDPQAVAREIISAHPKLNANARNAVISSAQAGRVVNAGGAAIYIPGTKECAASGVSSNVQLAQVGGKLALTGVSAAAMAGIGFGIGAALGPATLGISTLIGLFPLMFGHHAAAVKKEQNVLCTAVPAANNYFQVIDQAVRNGQVTPQHAIDALNSLQADFQSAVQPIMKECNAACVMNAAMQAAVKEQISRYQDLAAKQPPMTSGSGPTVAAPVASGGTMRLRTPGVASSSSTVRSSSWLPIAAIVVAGLFLARVH